MAVQHRPERGDDVEQWIKKWRNQYLGPIDGERTPQWFALDDLLDEYRLHADTGTPLDHEVEGPYGWAEA